MARPLAGFGFFTDEKRFDAETEGFEKVLIHAVLAKEETPAAFEASKAYKAGDKVSNGSKNYICQTDCTQETFEEKEKTPDAWVASHQYSIGDKVSNEGTNYKCTEAHQSSEEFAADVSKWETYVLVTYWTEYTLDGGKVEECKIVKQTGFNKYLVEANAEKNRRGIVILVNGEEGTQDEEGNPLVGTGYITVTKNDGGETANAFKIVRNIVETFPTVADGKETKPSETLSWKYELTEKDGKFTGKFVTDKELADCVLETAE